MTRIDMPFSQFERRQSDFGESELDQLIQSSADQEIKILCLFVKRTTVTMADIARTLQEQHVLNKDHQEKMLDQVKYLHKRFEDHERAWLKSNAEHNIWSKIAAFVSSIAVVFGAWMFNEYQNMRDNGRDLANRTAIIERIVSSQEEKFIDIDSRLTNFITDKRVSDIEKKKAVKYSR